MHLLLLESKNIANLRLDVPDLKSAPLPLSWALRAMPVQMYL